MLQKKSVSRLSLIFIAIGAVGLLGLEASAALNRVASPDTGEGNANPQNYASHESDPAPSSSVTTKAETPTISPTPIDSQTGDVSGDGDEEIETEDSVPKSQTYAVIKVIDGDTFVAMIHGVHETIRLIGVNAPETGGSREKECFGLEAAEALGMLLLESQVALAPDPTQDNRDKYGRLLRYSYLPDGRLLNKVLIQDGYAYEYTYRVPYQHQVEFQNAEEEAKSLQKGLWTESACLEG